MVGWRHGDAGTQATGWENVGPGSTLRKGRHVAERWTLEVHVQFADGGKLMSLGKHRLKDLETPEEIYQLCHTDLPASFPPLRSAATVPSMVGIDGP